MARKSNSFQVWRTLVGTALFFSCVTAFADVRLTLHRIGDTQVVLTGSGTLGSLVPAENQHSLLLEDPFSSRPAPLSVHSILEDSDLHAGSFFFNFANAAGNGIGDSFSNTVYIGRDIGILPFPIIPSGEPLAGSMMLRLASGESFAPVGSTGRVFWGTTTGNVMGVLSGSWEMVAASPVPEPSSLFTMVAGLLLLTCSRIRSRAILAVRRLHAAADA